MLGADCVSGSVENNPDPCQQLAITPAAQQLLICQHFLVHCMQQQFVNIQCTALEQNRIYDPLYVNICYSG